MMAANAGRSPADRRWTAGSPKSAEAQWRHDDAARLPGARFLRLHLRRCGELLRGRRAGARQGAAPARRRRPDRPLRDAADGIDHAACRRAAPAGAPQRRPPRTRAALHRPLDRRPRRADAADAGPARRARRRRGAHCPADADGHLRGDAAPRDAARQSLPLGPGPHAAAGAERAGHVGAGARRDSRGGEGHCAGGTAGRLAGTPGHPARSHRREPAAQDPVRSQGPGVEIPGRNRARPGRGAATHARGHRPVRRGRRGPRRTSRTVASSPASRSRARRSASRR